MPYLCYCIDGANSAPLRQQAMKAHFKYIENMIDEILVAGPIRNSEDEPPIGSCFVYRTDSREKAMQLLHDDPYFEAGIWKEVRCQHFNAAAGTWVGGTTW